MTGRDARHTRRRLWKELWLAAALGAFGWGSSVSAQEPEPPKELDSKEVEAALSQVAKELGADVEIEFVVVATLPKDQSNGQSSSLRTFAAGKVPDTGVFEVDAKNFDVPRNGELWPVPPDGRVVILYEFSPAVLGNCIGNKCKHTGG